MLRARGEAEAAVVRAEADATAQATRAHGEAQAISTVFRAIHDGNPDQQLLAYRYLQALPQIAQGDANKLWIVPSEIGRALEGIGNFFGSRSDAAFSPNDRPLSPSDNGKPTAPGGLPVDSSVPATPELAAPDALPAPAALPVPELPAVPDFPAIPDVPATAVPAEGGVNGAVPEAGRNL